MAYTNPTDFALCLNTRSVASADIEFRNRLSPLAGTAPSVCASLINWVHSKAPLLVNLSMGASTHYLKVLYGIVKFITIFVVYYLVGSQLASKCFLYNKSMFWNLSTIDLKDSMPMNINPSIPRTMIGQRISVPFESGIMHYTKAASKVDTSTVSYSAYFHSPEFNTKTIAQSSYRSI